jgi:3-hydroxyacyl-CoA dehydrogenase
LATAAALNTKTAAVVIKAFIAGLLVRQGNFHGIRVFRPRYDIPVIEVLLPRL